MSLKKTTLALMALGFSAAGFAGTMGPVCTAENVTIPCHKHGWEFGAQALYLQTSYGSNFYNQYFTDPDGTTQFNDGELEWGWGFKLDGAYHFGSGNDLTLNWYHLDKNTGLTDLVNTAAAPVTLATNFDPKWDAVNAEYGQQVDYGLGQTIRFHGGVQLVRLSSNINSIYSGALTGVSSTLMKFTGFGPRVGADLSHHWSNGLSVYANAAGALVVGDSKFNATLNTAPIGTTSNTIVVPELEGKLGMQYTYVVANGDLNLNIGYLWQSYINALHNASLSSGSISPLANQVLATNLDVTLHGPYIGLKYRGYV